MLVTLKSLRVKEEVYSNFYLIYRKVYKTNNSMYNLRLQIILSYTNQNFLSNMLEIQWWITHFKTT